jgi:FAD/FMN-containing dehydrogenase
MSLSDLRAAFAGRLLTEPADTAPFLTDWRRKWTGRALAVAQPDTAADVAAVVRWCCAQRAAMVPQGGNTGLSGGATPDGSGRAIVLSMARLNKLRALDPVGSTLTAEAGVTLQQLQVGVDQRRAVPQPVGLARGHLGVAGRRGPGDQA